MIYLVKLIYIYRYSIVHYIPLCSMIFPMGYRYITPVDLHDLVHIGFSEKVVPVHDILSDRGSDTLDPMTSLRSDVLYVFLDAWTMGFLGDSPKETPTRPFLGVNKRCLFFNKRGMLWDSPINLDKLGRAAPITSVYYDIIMVIYL